MRSFVLSFFAGILLLQCFASLPHYELVIVLLSFSTIIYMIFVSFRKLLIFPLACSLGFVFHFANAYYHHAWQLSNNQEGKPILVEGYIASIPADSTHSIAFRFKADHYGLMQLNWRGYLAPLIAGDKWQLKVRIKRPYGTMNPGGFDYEAWAYQENIIAQGYVVNDSKNIKINSAWYHYPIDRVRHFLKLKIENVIPASKTSPWIMALAIGERQGIEQAAWEVLRNTGTNHLMAIAGLHIGLMAALAHFIIFNLWRRIPKLVLLLPASEAGAMAALVMALVYSALAGFSLPTQRASIMLFIFLLASLSRRKIPSWSAWNIALFFVLLSNPASVLTESFWLSFISVALIIYGVAGRVRANSLWWKWGRIQWVIALGLVPLSISLFKECSLVGFLANSLTIPIVGFIVVPLCLLGCFMLIFSDSAGGIILGFTDKVLHIAWQILEYLSHSSHAVWNQVIPLETSIIAMVGMLILLVPIGYPGRYFGLVWLLPMILYKPTSPDFGHASLTLLDVGQGLSAVIQTKHHILVYDTGASGLNFDMGERVVVPFLRTLSIKNIDMLVISHADNDHSGGALSLINRFPINDIRASVPSKISKASYCLQGMHWSWDGVDFSFLYPFNDTLNLGNDSSCVLRVTIGSKHILLAGDIERFAEKILLQRKREELSADIFVAPHHGSKTSAVKDFISAVHPTYILFPVGYRNRYHFPNQSVLSAYQDIQAIPYDTVTHGAISFLISPNEETLKPLSYRLNNHHYWNN